LLVDNIQDKWLDEWKLTQVYIHLQAIEFGLFATFGGKKGQNILSCG
jgi:hypothetical protein